MKTERKYDISIIIPVYNCEEYITECFNSLLKQHYNFNRIQVIMIDDGSKDNSFEVCKKLKGSHDNVIAITKENGGVSSTRNLGMSLAEGKYILFLDADDYLSDNAIKDIVAFFDEHCDEIDVVTYPIYYIYTDSIKKHFRYEKYFSYGTGVYDLNETPYVIQATVNVVIKNGLGVLFDEAKTFAEDEKFCTECIMQKYKLGYVEEAIYYYRKTSISAASTKTNPLYTFDDTMNYYEYLFNKYKENDKVAEYVQCLYLNNFRWRFNSKELLPTYLDEAGYNEAYSRLLHLVNQLDPKVILETPYMGQGQQAVLLKLQNKPFAYRVNEKGKVFITVDGEEYPFATLSVNIFRSKLIGKEWRLVGVIDHVSLADMDFEFTIDIEYTNGETKKIKPDLKVSQYSMFLQDKLMIPKYAFDVRINIENIHTVAFNIAASENAIPALLRFVRFSSPKITNGMYEIVYSRKKHLMINRKARFLKRLNLFHSLFKKNDKKIWLYNDRNGVFDNAYYQFLHDCAINDGVERYYVYNDDFDEIKDKFETIDKKQLVKHQSQKHIKLFMQSSKIISSFSDVKVYCPLGDERLELCGDFHYELIYLQHGILYANLRKMYTKENTDIDKFVVSSDFEIKNLTENYNYNREDLIEGGMPRLGIGKNESAKAEVAGKRKILLAPSWRKNLTGPLVNGTRLLDIPNFTSSEFYNRMQEFLNSEALVKLLKKFDLTLDLKLHPNFTGYEDLFEIESDRISIGFGNIRLEDYSLFITDFSSFQFDFINLTRPILYFIPDITEFRAGLHTYNKLEMSSDDLFGPMSYDIDETVENIKAVVNNDFKVSEPYEKRMKEFFNIADDPCEAIYNAIK